MRTWLFAVLGSFVLAAAAASLTKAESIPDMLKRLADEVEKLKKEVDDLKKAAAPVPKGAPSPSPGVAEIFVLKKRTGFGDCAYFIRKISIDGTPITDFRSVKKVSLAKEGPATVEIEAFIECGVPPTFPTSYACDGAGVVDFKNRGRYEVDVDPGLTARECRSAVFQDGTRIF